MTADERGQLWIAGADVWRWADVRGCSRTPAEQSSKPRAGFGIQKAANDWPGGAARVLYMCGAP